MDPKQHPNIWTFLVLDFPLINKISKIIDIGLIIQHSDTVLVQFRNKQWLLRACCRIMF